MKGKDEGERALELCLKHGLIHQDDGYAVDEEFMQLWNNFASNTAKVHSVEDIETGGEVVVMDFLKRKGTSQVSRKEVTMMANMIMGSFLGIKW